MLRMSGSLINLDLAGSPVDPLFFVWTGTNPTGTGFGGPLGSGTPQVGSTTDTLGAWVSSGRSPNGDLRHVYGISSVLIVAQSSVPEPSTLTLLGAAHSVGVAIGWARYRRHDRRGAFRSRAASAGALKPSRSKIPASSSEIEAFPWRKSRPVYSTRFDQRFVIDDRHAPEPPFEKSVPCFVLPVASRDSGSFTTRHAVIPARHRHINQFGSGDRHLGNLLGVYLYCTPCQ